MFPSATPIAALFRAVVKSSLAHDIAKVFGGTAVAQALVLCAAPVLSRLYTPADYGKYGAVIAVVGILASFSTLEYVQAVVLERTPKYAVALVIASLSSLVVIALIASFALYVSSAHMREWFSIGQVGYAFLVIPACLFAASAGSAFQAWQTRQQRFGVLSTSMIIRSVVLILAQIIGGCYDLGVIGLVLGGLLADTLTSFVMAFLARQDWVCFGSGLRFRDVRVVARLYRDFPIYAAPQNLLNAVSQGVPVLLIGNGFGASAAGAYALSTRVLQVPANFILSSIRPVLFRKFAAGNDIEDQYSLYQKSTLCLSLVGLVPAVALFIVAPFGTELVFGSNWGDAGRFIRWLVIWQYAAFCNVPAVLVLRASRRQKVLLAFDACLLALRVLSLLAGVVWFSPEMTVCLFGVLGFAANLGLILGVWISLGRQVGKEAIAEVATL